MSRLGEALGQAIADKNSMKSTLVRKDDISTWFLLPLTRLKISVKKAEVQKKSVAGLVLVWNHPDYGVWNSNYWGTCYGGSTSNVDFTLGSQTKGVLGVNKLGTGNVETDWTCNTYSTEVSDDLNSRITINGRNEVRDFLSNIGTARNASKIGYGSGTTSYDVTKTSIPSMLGSASIGVASRSSTKLCLEAEEYCVNVGTGTVRNIGLLSNDGSVLFNYAILSSSLAFDNQNNYKLKFDVEFEDDTGQNAVWTNDGTSLVADWFGGTSVNTPSHIGFGTGTVNVDKTHSSLDGEFIRKEISNYGNSEDGINTWLTNLSVSEGVGTSINLSGVFTGGTADGSAKMIVENEHYTVEKSDLFRIDLEHRNIIK